MHAVSLQQRASGSQLGTVEEQEREPGGLVLVEQAKERKV